MAKATHLLRKAAELVRERRYQDAVEAYLQATEADPRDSRAWFGLGVCLYRVGNLDVSRIALERARQMGFARAEEALARVQAAGERRIAEGKGAKATITRADVGKRAAREATEFQEPPPRPTTRPEQDKISLDRFVRVIVIENIQADCQAITEAVEGTIKDIEVIATDYGVSTSDTMSSRIRAEVVVLDWDTAPDAAAGLIQILKIKEPGLLVICLTEQWDPETAVEVLEAGADYHLVKEPHFASVIPLVIAQWARRDRALAQQQKAKGTEGAEEAWPDALNAVGEMLIHVASDYTILQANQAALRGFRKVEAEFIGTSYSRILYGEDQPPDSCPLLQVFQTARPASGEIRCPEPETTLSAHAWPVLSYAGKVSGAIALLREPAGAEPAVQAPKEREWLAEMANAGIVMMDPDGTLQYADSGFCTMLDQTEEALVGQPIQSLTPPGQQESLRECLQAAVDRGEASERLSLERSDGSTVRVEARVAHFAGADEAHLILTAFSVPELAGAEQEFWTEARRFASVLNEGVDKLECGVVVLDARGSITWANSLAAELCSEQKETLIGRDYLELLADNLQDSIENAESFLTALTDAHERNAALEDYSLRIGDVAGREALSYWSTPVEGGSHFVARVEHFYPAQEAAAVELTVPAGTDSLAGIAAAVPEMLFTADAEGKITWCNPAAAAITGYKTRRIPGMTLTDLAVPEARVDLQGLMERALAQPSVQKGEFLMARRDATRYWGEMTLLSIRQEGKAELMVVQGVLRDITDRKMTEAIRDILAGRRPV